MNANSRVGMSEFTSNHGTFASFIRQKACRGKLPRRQASLTSDILASAPPTSKLDLSGTERTRLKASCGWDRRFFELATSTFNMLLVREGGGDLRQYIAR